MPADQRRDSVAAPDQRSIMGEEALAQKCSFPATPARHIRSMQSEGSLPQGSSSTLLPSTIKVVEKGDVSERQPLNHQPQTPSAHPFLHSVPQKQPLPQKPTIQHPFERPTQLVPAQQKRAPPARFQGMPPPSSSSASFQPKKVPNQRPAFQLSFPSNLRYNENIPQLYRGDVLNKRIGIRPRNKKSNELQHIKNSGASGGERGVDLPPSMKIIVQQFMVANGYVYPRQHIPSWEQNAFRNSLEVRLDLHNTFKVTKETDEEQRLIKLAWARLDDYITEQSREWRAQGVLEQVSETSPPTFVAFTRRWTYRNWDGNTRGFIHAMRPTTALPVLSGSLQESNTESSITNFQQDREPSGQTIMLKADTERLTDNAHTELQPILKRPSQDGHDAQANKRVCNRDYVRITDNNTDVDHVQDEEASLELIRPVEKTLPLVIEAIHHAEAAMLDLAPMFAKDLAIMQQNRASHGFPAMLADTLKTGQAYTAMMGNYFDNALNLLNLLKESGHWKTSQTEVEVDCAVQKGREAPEQLQNGGLSNLSTYSNGKVGVQHSHERVDTTLDRSLEVKVSNQPVLPTADVKLDHSFQPEEGATPDRLHPNTGPDASVSIAKRAQVDDAYEVMPATPKDQYKDVAAATAPTGTAENPLIL